MTYFVHPSIAFCFLFAVLLVGWPSSSVEAQPNLVQFSVENFPTGTKKVASSTQGSSLIDTEEFKNVGLGPFDNLLEIIAKGSAGRLQAAIMAARQSGVSEAQVFDQAVDSLSGADKFVLGGAALGIVYFNSFDPFISSELTFINPTDEPLDISITSTQGTIPIAINTPLMFETLLTAEVTDSGGDGAALAGSVFVRYNRTLSDVTEPTDLNTVNSEAALDGVTNLNDGVIATDGTDPSNLFVSNLDVDFFDNLGVPEDDRGTIAISTLLSIEDLSPGDSITVRYGYSIGTDDHSIPLFPTEALITALEQDIFEVPEPATGLLLIPSSVILLRRRL